MAKNKSSRRQGSSGHKAANRTKDAAKDRMLKASVKWASSCPGFIEWKREHILHTLQYDDGFASSSTGALEDFAFSGKKKDEYTLIHRFTGLVETTEALKQCEYYFRRYPFHNLPVSHSEHLANICEMYFGRIYDFKERLKKYFDALKNALPQHTIKAEVFINRYKKEFCDELKMRNLSVHRERYENIAFDKIFLMGIRLTPESEKMRILAENRVYRSVAKVWVERVRRGGAKMDEFLEEVAIATLDNCQFLSVLLKDK